MIDLVAKPLGTFPARLVSGAFPEAGTAAPFDPSTGITAAEWLDLLQARLLTLPTEPPAEPGQLWLNAGIPTITPSE